MVQAPQVKGRGSSLFPLMKLIGKTLFLVVVLIVLCQNPLIFPGAVDSMIHRSKEEAPEGVESTFLSTSDGKRLEVWRLDAAHPADVSPKPFPVIILHGNFGDLHRFFYVQRYFHSAGYVSYGLDYRGYGRSTGWPTEAGLYEDAEAFLRYVSEREKVAPADVALAGISLGSGPATYLAEKYRSKRLVLFAPYTSIPDVVQERPALGLLAPFVWIKFPNLQRLPHLTGTCIVVTHGKKDVKIRWDHTARLQSAAPHPEKFTAIYDDEADHNTVISRTWDEVIGAFNRCTE